MKKLEMAVGLLAILVFAAVFAVGCGAERSGSASSEPENKRSDDMPQGQRIQAEGGSFTRVSPEELNRAMGEQNLVLVNTHIPYAGDLPGTDLSVPYDEIDENLDRLPGRDERIVLYCEGGPMSDEAARTLVSLGYSNVWDLDGGMDAWQRAGFELEGL